MEAGSKMYLEQKVKRKLVLVIDDEMYIRMAITDILNIYDISVITAKTGREGCHRFKELQADIDLIILDLSMPDIGGEEFYFRLRKTNKTMPILISSGHDENKAMKPFVGEKSVFYLPKPYRMDTLVEKVQSCFKNYL